MGNKVAFECRNNRSPLNAPFVKWIVPFVFNDEYNLKTLLQINHDGTKNKSFFKQGLAN